MDILYRLKSPITFRELRISSRSRGVFIARWIGGGLAIIFCLLLFGMGPWRLPWPPFRLVSAIACFGCAITAMTSTTTSLGQELREGILGTILVTGIRPVDIIIGRLTADLLRELICVLAGLPILSVCLLFGGVTFGEVARIGILLMVLLWVISTGKLFVQVFTVGRPVVIRRMALLPMCLYVFTPGSPFLTALPQSIHPIRSVWETIHPYTPYFQAFNGGNMALYWRSIGALFGIGCLALFLTCRYLPVFWREREEVGNSGPAEPLRDAPAAKKKKSGKARRTFRPIPDRLNPMVPQIQSTAPMGWLRACQVPIYLIAIVVIAAYLLLANQPESAVIAMWIAVPAVCFSVDLVAVLTQFRLGQYIMADRKSGALEMVIGTPLGIGGIASGLIDGLRRPLKAVVLSNQLVFWIAMLGLCLHQLCLPIGSPWRLFRSFDSRELLVPILSLLAAYSTIMISGFFCAPWFSLWEGMTQNAGKRVGATAAIRFLYTMLMMILLISMMGGLTGKPRVIPPLAALTTFLLVACQYLIRWWSRRQVLVDIPTFELQQHLAANHRTRRLRFVAATLLITGGVALALVFGLMAAYGL